MHGKIRHGLTGRVTSDVIATTPSEGSLEVLPTGRVTATIDSDSH